MDYLTIFYIIIGIIIFHLAFIISSFHDGYTGKLIQKQCFTKGFRKWYHACFFVFPCQLGVGFAKFIKSL
jgi:hypothetical protein